MAWRAWHASHAGLLGAARDAHGAHRSRWSDAASACRADVAGKFAASSWGKKLARQAAKKTATDFDRFKAAKAKTTRSAAIKAKLGA